METLLQLQDKRSKALKAVAAAATDKARNQAMGELDAVTMAIARFHSKLESKSVKTVKKEERYEEEDDSEEEEEESEEEEDDDEPKKPAMDKKSKEKAEDEDEGEEEEEDDSDDDDDDDDEDDEDDEESSASKSDDEEDDEDEEDEEEDDEKAAVSALSSARRMLSIVKKGGNAKAIGQARSLVKSVRRGVAPKATAKLRALKDTCARITGKKSVHAIMGALEGIAQTAASTEKLSKDVDRIKAKQRRDKVNVMLSTARRDGKINAKQVEALRVKGLKDTKWLSSYLSVLPKQVRSVTDGPVSGKTLESDATDADQQRQEKLSLQGMSTEEVKILATVAQGEGKSLDEFVDNMNRVKTKALREGSPLPITGKPDLKAVPGN